MDGRRGQQPGFVGRTAERRVLETELTDAARLGARAVLIEAEAGMGKTRLLDELASNADVLTLRARGYPLGSTSSFGLWAEALESHLRDVGTDEILDLCGGTAHDLAPYLRSAARAHGAPEEAPPAHRVIEGFASALVALSARQPLLVALDDVHHADASSWHALDYLVHNLGAAPVLVVAAARVGELGERREIVLRLEQDGLLRRLSLGPLEPTDIACLATDILGTRTDDTVRSVHERSGGNPLFAIGLLEASGGGTVDLDTVPPSLAERIIARIAVLDAPTREVLELLAVVGRRAEIGELGRVARRGDDELARNLEILVHAHLITEVDRGSHLAYEITHPLVAEAVYEHMRPIRRRALHRRIGRALHAADGFAEAASHYARSSEVGDEEAIATLTAAARRAWSRKTFAEAMVVMRWLLDLLEPNDDRWLAVLDVMSFDGDWLSYHGGDADYVLGAEIMRGMEPLLAETGEPHRLATFDLHLAGFLAWGCGDHDEAVRRAHRAVETFRRAGDPARARVAHSELAWIAGVAGDLETQETTALAALREAEMADDRQAVLSALIALAATLWPRGRFDDATSAFRRCIEIARSEGNVPRLRYGYSFLALSLALEGRMDDARASLETANATDATGAVSPATEIGVFISWFAGELNAALDEAGPAAAGIGVGRSWILLIASLAAAEAGETDPGRQTLADLERALDERRFWLMRQPSRWAKGLLAWREGDTDGSVRTLDAVATDLLDDDCIVPAAHVLTDLAEVATDARQPDVVRAAVGRLDRVADRVDRDLYVALARIGHTLEGIASGEPKTAADAALVASDLIGERGYHGLQGRALELRGMALARIDREASVAALERALEIYDAVGARWRSNRTRAALARSGKAGKRAASAVMGPDALTPREREVVALAREGLTAKEIGARLFINHRTVESHLAGAYAKLGVRSRVELVRRAQGLDL